jgi:hypothetical protein
MTMIIVGTEKGGYVLEGSGASWEVVGPMFPGWKVTALGRGPDGAHLAAVASTWFGAAVQRSEDLDSWEQIVDGPAFDEGTGRKLNQIWTFHTDGDRVWAGVEEAALFRSEYGGSSWEPVTGLNDHRTRESWFPGGGGLCAHRVLTSTGGRVWVGVSAAGVFRSFDGGETFEPANYGVPNIAYPGEDEAEVGYCVHSLAQDPDRPDVIWRQDHMGVFRTEDGGGSWERIESGLPAAFGFVMVRDGASGRLFVVPLEADVNRLPIDGRLMAYCSEDDGDSWRPAGTGWSDQPQFTSVLRGAVDADQQGLVAFGTTGGRIWLTEDAGDHWRELGISLPRILALKVVV